MRIRLKRNAAGPFGVRAKGDILDTGVDAIDVTMAANLVGKGLAVEVDVDDRPVLIARPTAEQVAAVNEGSGSKEGSP